MEAVKQGINITLTFYLGILSPTGILNKLDGLKQEWCKKKISRLKEEHEEKMQNKLKQLKFKRKNIVMRYFTSRGY